MCDMVWCYMWCHAKLDEVLWNVVMRCGMMVGYMWNMVVCRDAKCGLWNTEWCAIYIWIWWCSWRGVRWNEGMLWYSVPTGVVERFVVNYGAMWNVVMWNVAISEMVPLKCKMCDVEYCMVWNMVSWYVECCIMQDVAESYDVMWNVVKNVAYAMCCEIVWCHGCGKWCNVLRCQMWWCDVKSRCGGVMRCGIWCGVKYAAMLNVGVAVWKSCGCGMVRDVDCGCVMWNMCFEMWWC